MFWELFFPVRIFGLGNVMWGSDSLILVEKVCNYDWLSSHLWVAYPEAWSASVTLIAVPSLYIWLWRIVCASLQVVLMDRFFVNTCNSDVLIRGELWVFQFCHLGHYLMEFLSISNLFISNPPSLFYSEIVFSAYSFFLCNKNQMNLNCGFKLCQTLCEIISMHFSQIILTTTMWGGLYY